MALAILWMGLRGDREGLPSMLATSFIGSWACSWAMAPSEAILLLAKMCWQPWPSLGSCWEVHATRADPTESLPSLHQVAKCLTMMLAVYLAKEVAAILPGTMPQWAWPYSCTPSATQKLKPSASGTRFTDWIGGIWYADYPAGLVSCPLSPSDTSSVARHGVFHDRRHHSEHDEVYHTRMRKRTRRF